MVTIQLFPLFALPTVLARAKEPFPSSNLFSLCYLTKRVALTRAISSPSSLLGEPESYCVPEGPCVQHGVIWGTSSPFGVFKCL